jgi:long-subunit fatty acid transport protein
MKKIAILISALINIPFLLSAQTDIDMIRYSQLSVTGTARFVSMSGAFGALGGDLSAMSNNPAGIGLYRKSELSLSPSIYSSKVNAGYLGNSNTEFKNNFNFGNIGMVLNFPVQRYDTLNGWNSFNFAIGYNRINNYSLKTGFTGINPKSSYIDNFLDNSNAGSGTNYKDLDPFGAGLAFWTFMINPISKRDTNHYASAIPSAGASQVFKSITSGSTGEIPITFAGNYSDKLYLGATLGIPYINYQEDISFTENATKTTIDRNKRDSVPVFKSYTLNKSLTTSGTGLNFKIGMIYRVQDWFRIGASLHSPTYYQMNDAYNSKMVSTFEKEKEHSKSSPNGSFSYQINTPMRATGSMAFIIGKLGLISADVEYVDYSEMKISSTTDLFYDVNQKVQDKYTSTTNFKLGTEWRYKEFSFRGGMAHYGSPFKNSANSLPSYFPFSSQAVDNSKNALSLGVGIRDRDYFIDFGYVYTSSKSLYTPYSSQNGTPESVQFISSQNFVVTTGFKF